jgi:hypothetical protein
MDMSSDTALVGLSPKDNVKGTFGRQISIVFWCHKSQKYWTELKTKLHSNFDNFSISTNATSSTMELLILVISVVYQNRPK